MKIVKLICLVVVEVLLVGILVFPHAQRHPQSQMHAFSAWYRNPTPETYSLWQKENRKLQREDLMFQFFVFCAIALTTMGVVRSIRNMQNRPDDAATNGTYELTGIRPLSLEMTAGYLVAPSAAVQRAPFFFGTINVKPGVDDSNETPQLKVPLISENRLKLARRSIRYLGWPGRKEKDVWLPRSEGDVIFLPDIVIDSMDKNRSRQVLGF